MKIIIGIDASRAAKKHKTGTEWYAYHVIQELKKIVPTEYEVRLYSSTILTGELGQLPMHWNNVVLPWRGYLWTTVRLAWEMLVCPPDVMWLPCSGLPLVLPHKTVNTIHDIGFDRFPRAYKRRVVWFHRYYVRQALRRCSALVSVSEFTKRELIDVYHSDSDNISVTPLAADTKFHLYNDEQTAATLEHYDIKTPYVLFVGRTENKKNIPRLLEAFKNVSAIEQDITLVLVGPSGDAEDKVQSAIALLPNRIKHLSWVSAEDLPRIMAGARVFAFPTLYEGFGIPILEAFASGVPVLTSVGGAHSEVGGDAVVSVDPLKSEEIAGGLIKLLQDESLRQSLVEQGFTRVRQFSWQKTAEMTWQVLEREVKR